MTIIIELGQIYLGAGLLSIPFNAYRSWRRISRNELCKACRANRRHFQTMRKAVPKIYYTVSTFKHIGKATIWPAYIRGCRACAKNTKT